MKDNYSPLVHAPNDVYVETHEPEALGINKVLCRKSTVPDIYMLHYVLPQVAKLSKTVQTVELDLTIVSGLVKSVLHSIDTVLLPAANWVLELIDAQGETGCHLYLTNDSILYQFIPKQCGKTFPCRFEKQHYQYF